MKVNIHHVGKIIGAAIFFLLTAIPASLFVGAATGNFVAAFGIPFQFAWGVCSVLWLGVCIVLMQEALHSH